jgi:CBS domain-containing protein
MSRSYTAILPDVTLQQLVDQHILGRGQRSFVVEQNETLAGLLTLHHLKEIPRSAWPTTTVAQAMIPAAMKSTRPEAELWVALEEIDRDGVNQLPVLTNGHGVGMLSREDVVSFLRMLRELNA